MVGGILNRACAWALALIGLSLVFSGCHLVPLHASDRKPAARTVSKGECRAGDRGVEVRYLDEAGTRQCRTRQCEPIEGKTKKLLNGKWKKWGKWDLCV